MRDGWLLATGTLTALPVPPPRRVETSTARAAVLLAPLAVLPLAAGILAVGLLGAPTGLPGPAVALLGVALLALSSRALHWDGLSDTVDGLAASYDRERSLEVMKSGTSGPAGVLATVLVVGLQVAALTSLLGTTEGTVLAAVAVCASRGALSLTCLRGVPPARRGGLGHPLAEVVPPAAAAATWVVLLAALTATMLWAGLEWWRAPLAVVAALLVVALLVRRTVRRFGGVTGDVYGAAIELCLTALLLASA